MTSQSLSVPRALDARSEPQHRLQSILLAAFVAGLFIAGAAAAKQQCNTEAGKQGYWSWRMIDGRKCWYEGKPMLSKALLEWPAESAALPDAKADSASGAENPRSESHGDPMDAQAYAPPDSPTFEALWRDRIEGARK
jgi:hypothetical protein